MSTPVVLVDENDHRLGTADKRRAHVEGWLHRAFSVFVFDSTGHLLLQQRTPDKYHSGGLWSNTCCSHPHPEEPPAKGALRRLEEEMGFTCALTPTFSFTYRARVGPQRIEHEFDHVFIGIVDTVTVRPDPGEVADWAWEPVSGLRSHVASHPDMYTVWFRELLDPVLEAVSFAGTAASVKEAVAEDRGRSGRS